MFLADANAIGLECDRISYLLLSLLRLTKSALDGESRSPTVQESSTKVSCRKPNDDTHVCNQMLFAIVHSGNLGFTLRHEVVLFDIFLEQKFL